MSMKALESSNRERWEISFRERQWILNSNRRKLFPVLEAQQISPRIKAGWRGTCIKRTEKQRQGRLSMAICGAEETAQQLKALTVLLEEPSSVPSTHVQLTPVCNSMVWHPIQTYMQTKQQCTQSQYIIWKWHSAIFLDQCLAGPSSEMFVLAAVGNKHRDPQPARQWKALEHSVTTNTSFRLSSPPLTC